MRPQPARLWDFAGTDGLAVAQAVFGPDAAHLAAYQSQETDSHGIPCSLLRLSEGNFRVQGYGDVGRLTEALDSEASGRRVWVKPSPLIVIRVKEDALALLPNVAIVKAPHRLRGLPVHHAVPVRIKGCAALVWRHPVDGVPTLELHTALQERAAVCQAITEQSKTSLLTR